MANGIMIDFTGRVSFDPREVGKNGTKSYQVGAYAGKNRDTKKSEYFNFDVIDWNGVCADAVKANDYVHIVGEMRKGSYHGKDGAVKETMNITPTVMAVVPNPFDGASEKPKTIAQVENETEICF